jgi:hypothetical protein
MGHNFNVVAVSSTWGTKRTWRTDPEGKVRDYLTPNIEDQKQLPTGPIQPDFSI